MERPRDIISQEIGAFLDTIPEQVAEQLLLFVEEHARDGLAIDEEQQNLSGLLRLLRRELDPQRRIEVVVNHLTVPICAQLAALELANRPVTDERRQRLLRVLSTRWLQPWAAQALLLMRERGTLHDVLEMRELEYDDLWIHADMALRTLSVVLYRYGNEEAVPLIRLGLEFPDSRIQFAAAELLSPRYADTDVINVLIRTVETTTAPNHDRLESAINALTDISPELISRIQPKTLLQCLMHPAPNVRRSAITALSSYAKDVPGLDRRLERIRIKDTDPMVRVAALEALAVVEENPQTCESYFYDEIQRPDAALISEFLDFVVTRCRDSATLRVILYTGSQGVFSSDPWRRFWYAVALARLTPEAAGKALELYHELPSSLKPLAPNIFPHPQILEGLAPWATNVLSSDPITKAEKDFVFTSSGGDVRAGQAKVHQVEKALRILTHVSSPMDDNVVEFAINLLMLPLDIYGGAFDNWGKSRTLASALLAQHGTRETLARLEARLPAADQPELVEKTIATLRRTLQGGNHTDTGDAHHD